jgi:YfiH family protein
LSSNDPLVWNNCERFLSAIGAAGWPLLKLKQVHSGNVCEVDDVTARDSALAGDAAVTAVEGSLLSIQSADCVPILIADVKARAVAAVHAGWRGTAARIAEAAVGRLSNKFGIRPSDLMAAIGPHIGVCCYEVGDDVIEAVGDPAVFERRIDWTKPHLNLAAANRRQLLNAGISDDRVLVSSLCTRCRADMFFSYRREGSQTGRMLSVIGIAP